MPDLTHSLDYQHLDVPGVKTPAGDPPRERLDQIDQELHMQHWDTPQSASLAHFALEKIREGLTDLAKLGHQYHLVSGSELVLRTDEYPKMLTRKDPYPFELTVGNELEERDARAQGYGFHSDGKEAAPQPNTPLEQIAQQPVGSGREPDPGALTAVEPKVLEHPPENPPSSTNLDKTIDGALGAPNNVDYQAPKPAVTDKQELEASEAKGENTTPEPQLAPDGEEEPED